MSSDSVSLVRPGVGNRARVEVLDAAAEEFTERGFSGASIDSIADRLGATKGLIYHYYRSKADLYLDVLREATNVAIAAVEPIATGPLPALERLRAMAVAHVNLIFDDFALQRVTAQGLVPQANATVRGGLDHVIAIRDRYERLFVDAITDGVSDKSLRAVNPRFAVKPFLGALNWTIFWYRPEAFGTDGKRGLAEELADYAVRGLLAD